MFHSWLQCTKLKCGNTNVGVSFLHKEFGLEQRSPNKPVVVY